MTDYPPDNYTLAVRKWLAEEIYPGLLGETFDDRAAAVWVDGSQGFVSLWAGGLGAGQPADVRLQLCKDELYRRIDAVAHPAEQPEPGGVTSRPLVGPLRVQDKLFRDDTGYRRVFGDSDFTLLRKLKYDTAAFAQSQDDCVAAGFQTRRVFLSVGGWADYWDGHEVVPVGFTKWLFSRDTGHLRPAGLGAFVPAWPDYDDLFRALLRDCKARGLRLHVTFGDCQIILADPAVEIALHDRLARIAAEEGGAEVIAYWEVTNEYPLNRYGGGGDDSVAQMGRVIQTVKRHLPNVLCAQGACLSEEPEELRKSITHGDICAVHTVRDPFAVCLKRTLGLVFWEGNYRAFPKPYLQGEPKGMNVGPMDGRGDDMYLPSTDPAEMTALYAAHALTGQASNFFDGAAVRGTARSADGWGYRQLPALFAQVLPEDVATWAHETNGRGGVMYWTKGQDFATSTFKEWDTTPPRPIASWTLYSGDQVQTGTGTPPRATGLIVGRFA